MKIYFIRHSESAANTENRYQGKLFDTDLTERGVEMSKAS